MLETGHRILTPQRGRAAGLALLADHAIDRLRKPLGPLARRVRFAVVLLLCTATALTLYELAGLTFHTDGTGVTGSMAIWQILVWFIGLTPAAVLMVLMGGAISKRPFTRLLLLTVGVLCAAAAGAILQGLLLNSGDAALLLVHARQVLSDFNGIALAAALLVTVYEFHRRTLDAAEAAFRVQADRIVLEAEVSKARLRLLRAQIEPHFIFNSLAHVRRLYQIDAPMGHNMLGSLIRYFTGALPNLRRETCSLAEEAALIDAYLDIHRLRMRSRLEYTVNFPADLLAIQVPSLILLTLVENAIKHGVSPLPEGGFVHVTALARNHIVELRVADSGYGMTKSSGHGTGLANIRARLSTIYGTAASLTLSANRPRGIVAAVQLPLLP